MHGMWCGDPSTLALFGEGPLFEAHSYMCVFGIAALPQAKETEREGGTEGGKGRREGGSWSRKKRDNGYIWSMKVHIIEIAVSLLELW